MNGMFEIFKQRFFQTLPALKISLEFTPSVIFSQFGGGRGPALTGTNPTPCVLV